MARCDTNSSRVLDTKPSLITQMIIAEKYGLRLDVNQLAHLLGITAGTVLNRISANTFSIPTYIDGGKRYADYRDVAWHFDSSRLYAVSKLQDTK